MVVISCDCTVHSCMLHGDMYNGCLLKKTVIFLGGMVADLGVVNSDISVQRFLSFVFT